MSSAGWEDDEYDEDDYDAWGQYDDPDDDPGDYYDRDDDYEPDPEDYEIARQYEADAEHSDQVHGGGRCDCKPPLLTRVRQAYHRALARLRNLRRRDNSGWDDGMPPF
jgi:hypothetical protein